MESNAKFDEESVSAVTVRFQQVSVIQRTPGLFLRNAEAVPQGPKKPTKSLLPANKDEDEDDDGKDKKDKKSVDDVVEPVQEAPIDYHVPRRSQSPDGSDGGDVDGVKEPRRRRARSQDGAIDMRSDDFLLYFITNDN